MYIYTRITRIVCYIDLLFLCFPTPIFEALALILEGFAEKQYFFLLFP